MHIYKYILCDVKSILRFLSLKTITHTLQYQTQTVNNTIKKLTNCWFNFEIIFDWFINSAEKWVFRLGFQTQTHKWVWSPLCMGKKNNQLTIFPCLYLEFKVIFYFELLLRTAAVHFCMISNFFFIFYK
jgi:hypothetical protein